MSKFYYATPICRVIIISLGLLGNIISFIIFSRKTFRKNSISTYCRALAVLDCIIIIELIHIVHYIINSTKLDFSNLTDATCKIFYYLSAQYGSIPAWILVAFFRRQNAQYATFASKNNKIKTLSMVCSRWNRCISPSVLH